jgi:2-methylcitrate dehydratase PrpD
MSDVTAAFVRDMLAIDVASVPPSTVAKAELCLLDYLSCAFAARHIAPVEAAIRAAGAWPADSGCPVIATALRLAPAEAAYLNSVMAAAAQRTDMHPAITSHCAPVVFPIALAIASQCRISGAEFLAAVIAGYEAMARVGRVMVTDAFRRRFRATSVLGSVGGAVTASRLLGLSLAQSVSALALSVNTASGLMEFGHSGAVDLYFQPANAARNAVAAAMLAREGVVASGSILEGTAGLLAAFGGLERARDIVDTPRSGYEIDAVDFKRVPACVFVQAAAHAAERIALRESIRADDVTGIELRTFEAAVRYPGCDDPGPIDSVPAARMSLQYAVASVLARGELTEDNFTDIANPATRALVPKVSVAIVDRYTAAYPARQGADVIVRTRDGRVLEGAVTEVPSFDCDGIVARYRRVGLALAASAHVEALEAMCLNCASLSDVTPLVKGVGFAPAGVCASRATAQQVPVTS